MKKLFYFILFALPFLANAQEQKGTPIVIDDVTNINGMLQVVDAPPGVNAYEIIVSKDGFTTDQTYTPGAAGNPNPTKPHATVAIQQLTQISFVIDEVRVGGSEIAKNCVKVHPFASVIIQA